MLHITATIEGTTATVTGVYDSAREARDHEADNTISMPVSMAQPRSLLPRVGQMLAICREASGPVAVAMVRP